MNFSGYQIVGVTIGLLLILLTLYQHSRGRLSRISFMGWTVLWAGMVLTGFFPEYYLPIAHAIGMDTPTQFVSAFSIIILFILVFQVYAGVVRIDKRLTKIAQSLALTRFEATPKELRSRPRGRDMGDE